jgi:hypothetical protein
MTKCGFTYGHYRETLIASRPSYAFVSFETACAPDAPERFIVLRHDVDYALEDALPLARLEAEVGVSATYLVLPHAHYNPFGNPGFGILRAIVGLGHALGVHYDPSFYAAHALAPAATLRQEAARLAAAFDTPVRVVAEHKPGRSPLPPPDLTGFIDAYVSALTRDVKYLSDSCQFWREGCFCGRLEAASVPRLQILTHPEWWSEEGTTADAILDRWSKRRERDARADREAELREFAGLAHLGNRHLFIPKDREPG